MDELNIHSTEGFDKSESITPGENDKQVVVKFKQAYPWWQDTFSFLLPPQVDSAGEFDATNVAAKERLATIQDMDNIEIRAAIRPANVLFVMNSDAPGLDDIKVREAFMTAIDRDPLASIRFNDLDYEEDLPGSFTLYRKRPSSCSTMPAGPRAPTAPTRGTASRWPCATCSPATTRGSRRRLPPPRRSWRTSASSWTSRSARRRNSPRSSPSATSASSRWLSPPHPRWAWRASTRSTPRIRS